MTMTGSALLAPIGCYRHVVRAEGMGGQDHEIHEPNLPDEPSWIDQVLFGDSPVRSDRPADVPTVQPQ